jgi:hypothetical protein
VDRRHCTDHHDADSQCRETRQETQHKPYAAEKLKKHTK